MKNRIINVMSCCIDLHYLMYYRNDLHCGMSGDWSAEVFGSFHLCLFLSYVNQTTKSNLSKNYYQIQSTGFPKQKTNFLPSRQLFSSIITKCVTYFNPLMPGGRKRSNILKQTYTQKLLFILSMCDLLCDPAWEC